METPEVRYDKTLSSLMYKHGQDLDLAIEKFRKDVIKTQADCLVEKICGEGRCPKCTLKLPCKHFKESAEVNQEVSTRSTPPLIQISTPSSMKSKNNSFNGLQKNFKIRIRGRSKPSPESLKQIDEFEKLRVMEKLEKYKEEKLLKEIEQIENAKKIEEELMVQERFVQKKRESYFSTQKNKVMQYREDLRKKMASMQRRRQLEEQLQRLNFEKHQKALEEKKQRILEFHTQKKPENSNASLNSSPTTQKSPKSKTLSLKPSNFHKSVNN